MGRRVIGPPFPSTRPLAPYEWPLPDSNTNSRGLIWRQLPDSDVRGDQSANTHFVAAYFPNGRWAGDKGSSCWKTQSLEKRKNRIASGHPSSDIFEPPRHLLSPDIPPFSEKSTFSTPTVFINNYGQALVI